MVDRQPSMSDRLVHSEQPLNAEPALRRLRAAFITAQSDFYIRSHGAIPHLDEATHRLHVNGQVASPLNLSIRELRERFPRRTVRAVMQCAGNRRADMHRLRPVSGDLWSPGAIGHAEWTGVALSDVLRAAGASDDPALHVAFSACDEVQMEGEGRFCYGVSIPMTKAMSPEVLLALEMNNQPLAPEHGFPLRVVVPGFAGVRSPKWLSAITVQSTPSDNHMQQRDYKLLPPEVTKETVDWQQGIPIYDMPLNAAICEPAPHAEIQAGTTILRGYAVATARAITRVDVSFDEGQNWRQAELESDSAASWSWTFWHVAVDLPPGQHELIARAWDSAGQTQPAQVADTWNFKGYLCAAWHRVPVLVR